MPFKNLRHIHQILVCINLSNYMISLTKTSSFHRPQKKFPNKKMHYDILWPKGSTIAKTYAAP
jgi:hypothetical protein